MVKRLRISSRPRVASRALNALAAGWGPTSLFPNLRTISWNTIDDHAPFLRAILSPSVTELSLSPSTVYPSSMLFSVLSSVQRVCPALTTLRVHPSPHDAVYELPAVTALVRHCTPLRSLKLPGVRLDADAIAHVGGLPGLRSFEMSVEAGQAPPRHGAFTDLENLLLRGHLSAKYCLALLENITSAGLQQLVLDSTAQQPDLTWNIVLGAMHAQLAFSALTLNHLTVSEDYTLDQAPLDGIERLDLEPLLAFGNLTEVCIRVAYPPDPTDADLRALASAWPRLRWLDLSSSCDWAPYPRPRATLWGLVPFAEHCPSLVRLALLVDACVPRRYSGKPGRGAACGALTELHVGASPIAGATLVAAFLSDIFPRLETVDCNEVTTLHLEEEAQRERKRQRVWDKVERLLPTLGAIRVFERLHVDGGSRDRLPFVEASDGSSTSDDSETDSSSDFVITD
ncbi:hypothetical protein BD626DRAFT_159505 [Schizophyllum amplum]|uniref:F-box domain-containing protein n=1 Tax=Schizophyllum amplum TaxID=97359 RepID=A0A550CNX5_9AGAR|nr:hypothetical protein BD626DRAFT_159505 [Auriculariopsis ampla]